MFLLSWARRSSIFGECLLWKMPFVFDGKFESDGKHPNAISDNRTHYQKKFRKKNRIECVRKTNLIHKIRDLFLTKLLFIRCVCSYVFGTFFMLSRLLSGIKSRRLLLHIVFVPVTLCLFHFHLSDDTRDRVNINGPQSTTHKRTHNDFLFGFIHLFSVFNWCRRKVYRPFVRLVYGYVVTAFIVAHWSLSPTQTLSWPFFAAFPSL